MVGDRHVARRRASTRCWAGGNDECCWGICDTPASRLNEDWKTTKIGCLASRSNCACPLVTIPLLLGVPEEGVERTDEEARKFRQGEQASRIAMDVDGGRI